MENYYKFVDVFDRKQKKENKKRIKAINKSNHWKEIALYYFVGLPRDVHHILLYKSRAKCFNKIRNGP